MAILISARIVLLYERPGATDQMLTHETLPVFRLIRLTECCQSRKPELKAVSEVRFG